MRNFILTCTTIFATGLLASTLPAHAQDYDPYGAGGQYLTPMDAQSNYYRMQSKMQALGVQDDYDPYGTGGQYLTPMDAQSDYYRMQEKLQAAEQKARDNAN